MHSLLSGYRARTQFRHTTPNRLRLSARFGLRARLSQLSVTWKRSSSCDITIILSSCIRSLQSRGRPSTTDYNTLSIVVHHLSYLMLLQWVILEPSGPLENLAAVRFSSPVRVRSLRIFPTGARPFKQNEDIIACVCFS